MSSSSHHPDFRSIPSEGSDGEAPSQDIKHYANDTIQWNPAEDTLRRERDLLARIMDTSPCGITVTDRNGNIILANRRSEAILGLTKDEITQRTYDDPQWRITDYDGGRFPKESLPFQVVKRTGKPLYGATHAIEWPDGRRTLLSINATPLFDAAGAFDGTVAALEDVTQQVEAEKLLCEHQERYRGIFENTRNGVAVYSAVDDGRDFRIVDVNRAVEEIEQVRKETLLGKCVTQVFPGVESFGILDVFRRVWRSGQAEFFPLALYEDKRIAGWRDNYVYKLPSGEIVALYSDETKRVQTETALKESEARYRGLFTQMLDGFAIHEIILDEASQPIDYRFLNVNPAFERMTGLSAKTIIGKTVREVLSGIEESWIETYAVVAATGAPVRFRDYVKALDKHFEVLAFCPQQGMFATIFQDITEGKRFEEERKHLERQLRQAQKMEAIGALAGGIAHDFNNILFPILGYAELVQEELEPNGPLRRHMGQIITAGKRAKELVQQILTFSREAEQELKPLKVQLILKEALKLVRSSLPTTIEIRKDIDDRCSPVLADPTQVHQIIMNLITNAYQAMEKDGGLLEISLKEVEIPAQNLIDPSMDPGFYVCLGVRDTGGGMDQTVMERIFNPYFTTKEKGTGLGLAVVHGIVKAYGGAIQVSSRPGQGCRFDVYLPLIQIHTKSTDTQSDGIVAKGKETVLLVDDEVSIVDMLKQMLERLGYTVHSRSSSLEALEAFRAQPEAFDIVVSDMTMPHLTGTQLAENIRRIRPDIPIVICSGFSEKINTEVAAAMGIQGYILKPVIMSDLANTLRKILDRNQASASLL